MVYVATVGPSIFHVHPAKENSWWVMLWYFLPPEWPDNSAGVFFIHLHVWRAGKRKLKIEAQLPFFYSVLPRCVHSSV